MLSNKYTIMTDECIIVQVYVMLYLSDEMFYIQVVDGLEFNLDFRLKNPDGHFLNDESDQRGFCQLCGTCTT
jgi:hypothetical protein